MAAAFTQDVKPIRITTPLGKDILLIENISAYEAVSQPFELTLDLLSTDARIDPDALLRKPVTVTVDMHNAKPRYFHGLVRRVSQGGRGDTFVSYRVEVVPTIWFLSLITDCRIFQNLTVPQIVQKVLTDTGITDVKLNLSGTYEPREYCVQYRETSLAFISRLLEEEGIFYFFEHSIDKHVLVLADAPAAVKPGVVAKLPISFVTASGSDFEEGISSFELETLVRPGKSTLVDYNDLQTKKLQGSSSSANAKPSAKNLELYDYPGKFDAIAGGDRYAKLRLEAEEAIAKVVVGTTNSRGLSTGQKLTVSEHYRSDLNQAYMLLTLTHNGRVGGYGASDTTDDFYFESRFSAIPASVPYRPIHRAPKPIVYGTQTAVVVGPTGEEIFVDKYGRVKVQFFWDRLGENDDKSSCWVRVSSTWAGKGWGAIHIPRIGQEVVVDFLEGDPDRPIITGRVYNSEQIVPFDLPANSSQSGIVSRSTKQGGTANFNALRFEDKKGSEQVLLHAEKNMDTEVENDETHWVGHDITTTIDHDETLHTKHDQTVTIDNNQSITITEGNRSVKVSKGNHEVMVAKGDDTYTVDKGKQTIVVEKDRATTIRTGNETLTVTTGNMTTSVDQGNVEHTVKMGNVTNAVKMGNVSTKIDMGNLATKLGLGAATTEAMQGIELKVGSNSIKIDQTGVTIKGLMIKIEGTVQTEVKGLMTSVNGSAMLTVKGGITMIN